MQVHCNCTNNGFVAPETDMSSKLEELVRDIEA